MIETQSIQEAHAMLTFPLSHPLIGFPDGSVVKVPPARSGRRFGFDPGVGKIPRTRAATHSSFLVWKIP